jgi:hypothetical protein
VYQTTGDYELRAGADDATFSATIMVADNSWVTLQSVNHPAEVDPGHTFLVSGQLKNLSASPVSNLALTISAGEEEKTERQDLGAYAVWDFDWQFTAPRRVGTIPVTVTAVDDYQGSVLVVGQSFNIQSSCTPLQVKRGEKFACQWQAKNTGNRSGPMQIAISWPSLSVISGSIHADNGSDAWLDSGKLFWQAETVGIGNYINVSAWISATTVGTYTPELIFTPDWTRGEVDTSGVTIKVLSNPDGETGKIYLPIIMK